MPLWRHPRIVHALEVIEAVELVFLMECERGVERTASTRVAGGFRRRDAR